MKEAENLGLEIATTHGSLAAALREMAAFEQGGSGGNHYHYALGDDSGHWAFAHGLISVKAEKDTPGTLVRLTPLGREVVDALDTLMEDVDHARLDKS